MAGHPVCPAEGSKLDKRIHHCQGRVEIGDARKVRITDFRVRRVFCLLSLDLAFGSWLGALRFAGGICGAALVVAAWGAGFSAENAIVHLLLLLGS
jgi:hypothetical protein